MAKNTANMKETKKIEKPIVSFNSASPPIFAQREVSEVIKLKLSP